MSLETRGVVYFAKRILSMGPRPRDQAPEVALLGCRAEASTSRPQNRGAVTCQKDCPRGRRDARGTRRSCRHSYRIVAKPLGGTEEANLVDVRDVGMPNLILALSRATVRC